MTKLIFLFAFIVSLGVTGQTVRTISDQIEGVTVMQTDDIVVSGKSPVSVSFDVLCSNVAGTSEGTLVLQGRNHSSGTWQTLNNDFGDQIAFNVNDTLTVVDNAAWKISIPNATFRNYQFISTGGSGDTTAVTIYYMIRNN
jgi:hypothetical protein